MKNDVCAELNDKQYIDFFIDANVKTVNHFELDGIEEEEEAIQKTLNLWM